MTFRNLTCIRKIYILNISSHITQSFPSNPVCWEKHYEPIAYRYVKILKHLRWSSSTKYSCIREQFQVKKGNRIA